jgi:hypothetical protein
MYEIIRGPMAWCAFFVFISGMAFQIARFFFQSRRRPRIRLTPPDGHLHQSVSCVRFHSPGFSVAA